MNIFVQINEEIITPHKFVEIVKTGMPVGQTFWCKIGSLDSIKCVCLSHNHDVEKKLSSIEGQYQQFEVL